MPAWGSEAVANWGSTSAERAEPFPCDGLVVAPDATLYRAIDVRADPATVFRWLCQLRAAPYSYDWLDNLGHRSPRRLIEGLDRLDVGQRVMTIFTLKSFTPGEHITLFTRSRLFGDVGCTYRVAPASGGSRLVVKMVVRYSRGALGRSMRFVLPAGDLLMMRKQLRTLARLAEQR